MVWVSSPKGVISSNWTGLEMFEKKQYGHNTPSLLTAVFSGEFY
jgi:hypothetical protein